MAERELATVLGPFDDHLAPHEIFMNASHEDSATAVAAGWPELESRWTKPPGFAKTLNPGDPAASSLLHRGQVDDGLDNCEDSNVVAQ